MVKSNLFEFFFVINLQHEIAFDVCGFDRGYCVSIISSSSYADDRINIIFSDASLQISLAIDTLRGSEMETKREVSLPL